ncbi:aldo/keto reductase [Nocardioides sp. TF02-7]|uniref:aldo/keto reductase n=1 Tax=Nocardioides sp. TF02-7 TaxID=2917724 RepID=UPI001F05350F|nr:aldo/keto reductase [Nocardioides sp. TF02-7]UMG91385.1 aldo/keto reductase [Nocardioides sp. TF02-7]
MSEAAASRVIYGCMGLASVPQAEAAVEAALEAGITRFDHADIYGRGGAESVFGEVLRRSPGLRERIVVQSKVGIRLPEQGVVGHYDLGARAIREGVLGSLDRLGTDRLDVLLLHRPDPLLEPAEVAAAVAGLQEEGLVGGVGASNMSAAQLAALQEALPTPLVADQLEMSLARHGFVDSAVLVNHPEAVMVDFPHGTLEHCRRHGIELQAWGALAGGRYSGGPALEGDAAAEATAALVERMAGGARGAAGGGRARVADAAPGADRPGGRHDRPVPDPVVRRGGEGGGVDEPGRVVRALHRGPGEPGALTGREDRGLRILPWTSNRSPARSTRSPGPCSSAGPWTSSPASCSARTSRSTPTTTRRT